MSSPLLAEAITLTPADFRKISRLAYDQFGLNLPPGKEGLVASRLGKKLRQGNFGSFADYFKYVQSDGTGEALIELIDALATNYTSFLREPAHFEFLKKVATEDLRESSTLHVWSAACSSGEEPYSIAMTLSEVARTSPCCWKSNFQIIATDISTKVLRKAQEAIYDAERFDSIPEHWFRNYLLKGQGVRAGSFKLKPAVTSLVHFERLNLVEPLPQRKFHFIFCRNVMIYFDKPTQQGIVSRLTNCLEPGGYLFVGHSESLNGIEHSLRYVRPAVYRKEAGGANHRRRS